MLSKTQHVANNTRKFEVLQNMLIGNAGKVIHTCFPSKHLTSEMNAAIKILHQTYDLVPTTAEDEIKLLSQKHSAPSESIQPLHSEGLNALLDDIITCLPLVKGENNPHLLENKPFLKALVLRIPKENANNFQDNEQAATTEFHLTLW